jgi:hypothetical protein
VELNAINEYNKLRKSVPILEPERAKIFYETLYVFDLVLTKFRVEYSLMGGTLLGAVRSGGMIPWDDDLDVMVFNPEQKKIFEKEIVREFNKYGFNVYMECHRKLNRKCNDSFVNHIYKETYLGSSKYVTDEVFTIPNARWQDKHNPSKFNAGRRFHDAAVLDLWPHNNFENNKWRPKWHPYKEDDRDVLTTSEIWPLKRVKFGNFDVSVINECEAYLRRWAGDDCFEIPKWRRSHVINPTRSQKAYITDHSQVFINLKIPCLFDPTKL